MARTHEESLRELLGRVHERLSRARTVDSESRRLLLALTRDIERALGAGARTGAAEAPPPEGPERRPRMSGESLSSLEGLAARFDADHPALAQTLRELADLLGKVGI